MAVRVVHREDGEPGQDSLRNLTRFMNDDELRLSMFLLCFSTKNENEVKIIDE